MQDRDYLIALSTFTEFGPRRLSLLLNYFKSAKNIWLSSRKSLSDTHLSIKTVEKFLEHRKMLDIPKYLESLQKEKISVVSKSDLDYPRNLKELENAPHVLYIKGELKKSDDLSIAIVGTRIMTGYGREVASKFACELANLGITVISGLALGIDAAAQKAAIEAGGRTISVLASGLNIISPLANKALALEFIKGSGAVVSEYPLGYIPHPFDFPIRDRLIAGLSRAVIVVEGRMKSGTFYTVKAALDQGKPVFAVPGPINSPASEAPNYLIQNGAKLITNIRDVVDELNLEFKVNKEAVQKIIPDNPTDARLIKILEVEPLHLDEVVRISNIPTPEVSARLTIMEMKGLVKNMGDGVYKKIQ